MPQRVQQRLAPLWASAGKIFPRPGLGSEEDERVRVSADPVSRGRSPHLILITTSLTTRRKGGKRLRWRSWTCPASASDIGRLGRKPRLWGRRSHLNGRWWPERVIFNEGKGIPGLLL